MAGFILNNISIYNYSANNDRVVGTVEFTNGADNTKMTVKLDADDVARVFDILTDNISRTALKAAQGIMGAVHERARIAAEQAKPVEVLEHVEDAPQHEHLQDEKESNAVDNDGPF